MKLGIKQIIIVVLLLSISGCGLKGPLFIPPIKSKVTIKYAQQTPV